MRRLSARNLAAACAALSLALAAAPALAAEEGEAAPEPASEEESTEERLSTVERAVDVLLEEQDRLRTIIAVPESGQLQSYSGLGPAASKVYFKERGLSLGGYGEVRGRFFVDDNRAFNDVGVEDRSDELDALRAVFYVGYKFNDWIVFNSELEFEHAGTGGGGSVSTEFATLDFLLHEAFNLRAGLLLPPMGFINEIHEPVFFYGAARPEVERRIIPSTWRENGAGIYGTLFDRIDYRAYVINGFDGTGFDATGLRGGRQKGSEALAEHVAFVGRADVRVTDGVLVGGSVYAGKSGQNQTLVQGAAPNQFEVNVTDAFTTIWEVHAQVKRKGLHLRGLFTQAHVDDADELSQDLQLGANNGIAEEMRGWYAEAAYDVLPLLLPDTKMALEPFYRYERIDTQSEAADGFQQNGNLDRTFHVVGLQYKPHPQVVLKADYRDISSDDGKVADEFQVAFGYVF